MDFTEGLSCRGQLGRLVVRGAGADAGSQKIHLQCGLETKLTSSLIG
jgi:hypothetical protein